MRAGLLAAADRTIAELTGHDLLSADHGWEAAATLVTALAARGDLAAAVSALSRIPDFALCYSRAVRALAQAVARTDPACAEELAARLPEQSGGRALNAVATATLAAGHRQDAERIANAIEVPGWRAQALIGLVGALPSADALPPGLVEDALAAVTDPATHARLLAECAVTRDGKDRTRLLNQAKRRARKADGEDRWSVLAEIAVTEAEAGLPSVAETFAFARDLLLADFDESERDLRNCAACSFWRGTRRARQTIAAALPLLARSPVAGRAGPALVSRITAALGRLSPAGNGDADAADRTWRAPRPKVTGCSPRPPSPASPPVSRIRAPPVRRGTAATAARMAAGLRGEAARDRGRRAGDAYVAVGDFDAGESLALSLLPEENWDEEDDHDWEDEDADDEDGEEDGEGFGALLMTAVSVGGMVADALEAAGHHDRADALVRQIIGRMRALHPGHEMEFQSMEHEFDIDQARARGVTEPAGHATAWAPLERLLTGALSAASHGGEERPLDLSAVRRFIDEVPEGDPRTRARMMVIDELVAAG